MKKYLQKQNSSYLFWPLAILLFLTVGVFFSTSEVPKQQTIDSHAQQDPLTPTEIPTDMPTPTPVGALIDISFAIPGISSQGGNLKPLHPNRSIVLAVYDKDTNTADPTIRPLLTAQTEVTFDDNQDSPTYGLFVHNGFDMGSIPSGQYQLGLKTDQALLKVIKKKETDFHGTLFFFDQRYSYKTDFGTLLMGDIVPDPHGDNKFDMADYTAFMDCLRAQVDETNCSAKTFADFDDNGFVDEIDNNILLSTFRSLIAMGLPVPVASPTVLPTVTPQKTVTPTPPPSSNMNMVGIMFVLLLIVLVAMASTVFLKKKGLLKKSPKSEGINEKEYYIKKQSDDPTGGCWLTLADDSGQTLGHYHKTDVKDGFGHIKGTQKLKDGKTYIEIAKISWEK